MAGKIVIDAERCKGCQLCLTVCPHGVISISDKINSKGYLPAEAANPASCTGCASCAIICPDCAIEVYRDSPGNIKSIDPAKKNKTNNLVREST